MDSRTSHFIYKGGTQLDELNAITHIITQFKKQPQLKIQPQYIVKSKTLRKFYLQQQDVKNTKKINFNQSLTKTIILFSFIDLESLYINNCELISVEWILFLDAPNLRTLALMNNKISNFRSLIKSNLSKCQVINIQQNLTTQINFERMQLPFKEMKSLIFEYQINELIKSQDLSKLVKFNPQFILSIIFWGPIRIKQQKVGEKIKQKFCTKDIDTESVYKTVLIQLTMVDQLHDLHI